MSGLQARPTRVLIADDEELIRVGVRLILDQADDVEVVAAATDGAEAVDLALRHRPDVVLMDLRMPGTDGLSATRELAVRLPAAQVVVLTTFADDESVGQALSAGAAGFLLKDTGPHELIAAVHAVARGHAILSPHVTRAIIAQYVLTPASRASRARALVAGLTGRERDVLTLVGRGRSNAEIGRELGLGEGTVKTHVRHILAKLGRTNRVQAAILAHDAGLLPPQ